MTEALRRQVHEEFGFFNGIPGIFTGREAQVGAVAAEASLSPLDGQPIAEIHGASQQQTKAVITQAEGGFRAWRAVPMPQRAEVALAVARELETNVDRLSRLITLEMGKPLVESRAEVANAVEIFRYAAGLGRTIGGVNVASTRPGVELNERWHPLGPVLVITAFNFPLSLWAWNASLAVVCGNSVIWKPAPQTPLVAVATQHILKEVMLERNIPEGVFSCVIGGLEEVAAPLVASPHIPLVSATGSVAMGQAVAREVGARMGRLILELGGNAAALYTPSAEASLAIPTAFFSAFGTGGQRCTALRRLLVHDSQYDMVVKALKRAVGSMPIGSVLEKGQRLCPLVDERARKMFNQKIKELKGQGVDVFEPATELPAAGCYVKPALALLPAGAPQPQEETFGPLLYIQPYSEFDQALEAVNAVPQGLSAGIFSTDAREIARFTGPEGAESGMVAVNDNTGGLEVGLAFGGVKVSGVGAEKGADSWKNYMRRQSVSAVYTGGGPAYAGVDFSGIA